MERLKNIILEKGDIDDWKIDSEVQKKIDRVNVKPINPNFIIKYLFFRDTLSEEERKVFKLLITSDYQHDYESIGMNAIDYEKAYTSLKKKIHIEDSKLEEVYQCFKQTIMSQYKSKIFNIDLDMDLGDITTNIRYVSKIWDDFSYEQVKDMIRLNKISIPQHMDQLLERYFVSNDNKSTRSNIYIRNAEKEVNAILFGYSKKNELPIKGLYEVFIKNRDEFTEEQYFCLMVYKFQKASKKLFKQKYPNSPYIYGYDDLFRKLETMYFNITNYRELNFSKEKYESIREKFLTTTSTDRIHILDMFYGVGIRKHSIQEIADILNISYDDAHGKIHAIRNSALSLYLDRSSKRKIEESYYIPYILDETIELSDNSRMMLKQFLIDKKSYEEIAREHGITTRKVSIDLSKGILQIDFYRFGILKADTYTKEESNKILESYPFTREERNIIEMMLDGKTREEMMKLTGLEFQRVAYILNKFYKICRKEKSANVQIDENDIKKEVCAHISERVLNVNERLVLAKLYGISCEVNPEGKKYTEQEFRLEYPAISRKYCKILKDALDTVRAKKAGIIRASLAYMSRDDLKFSLMDPRIPISMEEREILNYSFELNGYPYKNLEELSGIFGIKVSAFKGKIERTFVKIYKYENGEIPASLSFECDIEPCLRYFPKSDQEILKDCYQKGLTHSEIAEKHGLTSNQVEPLIFRLNAHLHDLIENNANGFDFDYFWSVVSDEDLPFYGDKEKAKRIFYLYYEERMSAQEIIDFMKLDCRETAISRTISHLMMAVLKRREGIHKVKSYTPNEIMEYYLRNRDSMTSEQKEEYDKYFQYIQESNQESKLSVITTPKVPSQIVLDLTKEQNENVFSMGVTEKETVLEIIRKYRNLLSSTTINTLLNEYGITKRELMSGSEQMKVLRLLSQVNNKVVK